MHYRRNKRKAFCEERSIVRLVIKNTSLFWNLSLFFYAVCEAVSYHYRTIFYAVSYHYRILSQQSETGVIWQLFYFPSQLIIRHCGCKLASTRPCTDRSGQTDRMQTLLATDSQKTSISKHSSPSCRHTRAVSFHL